MLSADKVKAIRDKAEALGGQSLGQHGDLLVEMAAHRAMSYCGRDDIPPEMEQAVAALVLTLGEDGAVRSVQRGDTSVTYAAEGAVTAPQSLLAPFCRLGRVR